MSLAVLKREYEERRQALVDQLQKNPHLDPATQHQIYGAIQEIEHFLKTIDYQISLEQERNLNVDLSRDRPRPMVDQTKKAVYHVAHGTKRIFTEHLPNAAKKVYAVPQRYFDRKREERRLRQEIEAEVRMRREPHNEEHVILEHPHQDLQVRDEHLFPQPDPESGHVQPIESHERREEPLVPIKRVVVKKSLKAKNKKGGQHKPHLKREKNFKRYKR